MCPEDRPRKQVVKEEPNEVFHLLCSVCGRKAATLAKTKIYREGNRQGYVYTGTTHTETIPDDMWPKLQDLLRKGDVAGVNEHVKSVKELDNGIDAYCPECKQVYCKDELNIKEFYEEHCFECTYANCPMGHRYRCNG